MDDNQLNDQESELEADQKEPIDLGDEPTPAECPNCAQCQVEMQEYKTNWQRATADYQNLQKETATRRAEWASLSEQTILEEFIPVYDNFKKAFASKEQGTWNKEQESWVTGIGYIKKQFGDVLKNYQVEEIKTVGEKLDTRLHESVGEEEVEGKEPATIIKEVDGGYTMKGRVMKVAKVIIAK